MTSRHVRGLLPIAALLLLGVGATVLWHFMHDTPTPPSVSRQQTLPNTLPTPAPTPSPTAFDATQFSTTDPASPWVIVNKRRPLNPKTYAPTDLVTVGSGQYLRSEAAASLATMFSDARNAGLALSAASGYRSYATQVSVYNKEVADYGQAVADSESARPGFSEHQTGLSVDIAGGGCSITDCFATTREGIWAAAHAHSYGFILRYPAGATATTGYRPEAWHFRYVGINLATTMHERGITTLETFFAAGDAPDYQ